MTLAPSTVGKTERIEGTRTITSLIRIIRWCVEGGGLVRGRPDEIVDLLSQYEGFLAIAHHTNAVAETRRLEDDVPYWHPYPWGEPLEYLRLIEIMQCRGNQERDVCSDPWRGWHQNNGASAQDALALGHKLGFVGGTDDHCGYPGRAYAEEQGGLMHDPKSIILTGVWTPRVERQCLYDTLWARHTWAVWDTRAIVYYAVNNVLMGGELEVPKGTELTARIALSAEDALQSLEIVSEGATAWLGSFSDADVEVEVPLGQAKASTHYYLRGLLRNGGLIYASPVYVAVKL